MVALWLGEEIIKWNLKKFFYKQNGVRRPSDFFLRNATPSLDVKVHSRYSGKENKIEFKRFKNKDFWEKKRRDAEEKAARKAELLEDAADDVEYIEGEIAEIMEKLKEKQYELRKAKAKLAEAKRG